MQKNQTSVWAHLFKTCLGFFIGGIIAGIIDVSNALIMIGFIIAGGVIARAIDPAIYEEGTDSYGDIWMPVVLMGVPFGGLLGGLGYLIGKSIG